MKGRYEVTDGTDRRAIVELLESEGQFLLPMVELVDRAELAIDGGIGVMGRSNCRNHNGLALGGCRVRRN